MWKINFWVESRKEELSLLDMDFFILFKQKMSQAQSPDEMVNSSIYNMCISVIMTTYFLYKSYTNTYFMVQDHIQHRKATLL